MKSTCLYNFSELAILRKLKQLVFFTVQVTRGREDVHQTDDSLCDAGSTAWHWVKYMFLGSPDEVKY